MHLPTSRRRFLLTAAACTLSLRAAAGVSNGIDVLVARKFAPLAGLKAGLITNHTGLSRDGQTTIDLLAGAPGVKLAALFSPEHGIRGALDQSNIADGRDEKTGLPVFSLYGKTRRPTAAQLAGLDALIFDIQDIGCRFYTYIATMLEGMTAAAEHGKKFIVLDRVNPINGVTVEGPMRDGKESFTACHDLPVRHGMTVGELARMFAAERKLKLQLEVVQVEGWDRRKDLAATGLKWVNPSPNMRSLDAATLYPGLGLPEFTNVSVGRGTEAPFGLFGAPWIDGPALAAALQAADLPGLKVKPAEFTPAAGSAKFPGEKCQGISLTVTDRAALPAVRTGLSIVRHLWQKHGKTFQIDKVSTLLVHPGTLAALKAGKELAEIEASWTQALAAFRKRRASYLIYPED